VRYAVAPNLLSTAREGAIQVGSAVHRVVQPGLLPGGGGDEVRLRGRVGDLSGSCPSLRFTVRDTVVSTSDDTRFNRGDCSDVANGREVTVEGTQQSDGLVIADRVVLERR
jgi:hypothetical protein